MAKKYYVSSALAGWEHVLTASGPLAVVNSAVYEVAYNFDFVAGDALNVLDTHELLEESGGRVPAHQLRDREAPESIARAAVVLTVAAWQSYVEKLARVLLGCLLLREGGDELHDVLRLYESEVDRAATRLSTPNARNVRNLLRRVGFDPLPHWEMKTRWPGDMSRGEAVARIDGWLAVRHAIAHGGQLQPKAAKVLADATSELKVRPDEAAASVRFFGALAYATCDGAVGALGTDIDFE